MVKTISSEEKRYFAQIETSILTYRVLYNKNVQLSKLEKNIGVLRGPDLASCLHDPLKYPDR